MVKYDCMNELMDIMTENITTGLLTSCVRIMHEYQYYDIDPFLEYWRQRGFRVNSTWCVDSIVRSGDVSYVDALRQQCNDPNVFASHIIYISIVTNNMEMFKYGIGLNDVYITTHQMKEMICYGRIDMIRLVHLYLTPDLIRHTLYTGNMEIYRYIRGLFPNIRMTPHHFVLAACSTSAELVNAIEQELPSDFTITDTAMYKDDDISDECGFQSVEFVRRVYDRYQDVDSFKTLRMYPARWSVYEYMTELGCTNLGITSLQDPMLNVDHMNRGKLISWIRGNLSELKNVQINTLIDRIVESTDDQMDKDRIYDIWLTGLLKKSIPFIRNTYDQMMTWIGADQCHRDVVCALFLSEQYDHIDDIRGHPRL